MRNAGGASGPVDGGESGGDGLESIESFDGEITTGTVALGTLVTGMVALGTLTMGTLAMGTLAMGTLAMGTLTMGTLTMGTDGGDGRTSHDGGSTVMRDKCHSVSD